MLSKIQQLKRERLIDKLKGWALNGSFSARKRLENYFGILGDWKDEQASPYNADEFK